MSVACTSFVIWKCAVAQFHETCASGWTGRGTSHPPQTTIKSHPVYLRELPLRSSRTLKLVKLVTCFLSFREWHSSPPYFTSLKLNNAILKRRVVVKYDTNLSIRILSFSKTLNYFKLSVLNMIKKFPSAHYQESNIWCACPIRPLGV